MTESEWNMSDATMYAIRTLFDEMNNAHFKGNVKDWHRYLVILHKELYPFMNDNESVKARGFIDEARKNLSGEEGIYLHEKAELYHRYLAGKYKMLLKTARDRKKALEELR